MMIEKALTVLVILRETPDMRVYQYRHGHTGALLYAVFPHGQYDDMAEAPLVRDPVLLYDQGHWTGAGILWRHAQQEGPPC